MELLTPLLMTHILGLFPSSHLHALVCSSGSRGYHPMKEMLQNGVPGNTLLIESCDLRTIDDSNMTEKNMDEEDAPPPHCSYVYTFDGNGYTDNFEDLPLCIQEGITHHVAVVTNMRTIPRALLSSFEMNYTTLTTIDISQLSKVTRIEGRFLAGCSSLTSIDLSPLSQVTEMGPSFLAGCSGLKEIDLQPLSHLIVIQRSFLSGCTGLKKVDLSPFSQVTKIEASFLASCTGVKEIDLSTLTQVTQVGNFFLTRCTGLTSIDLTPLSNVSEVEGYFLCECDGLRVIDLSPLTRLRDIPDGSGPNIILPSHLKN